MGRVIVQQNTDQRSRRIGGIEFPKKGDKLARAVTLGHGMMEMAGNEVDSRRKSDRAQPLIFTRLAQRVTVGDVYMNDMNDTITHYHGRAPGRRAINVITEALVVRFGVDAAVEAANDVFFALRMDGFQADARGREPGDQTIEAGVDIFFIISGFAMWTVAAKRPSGPITFLSHRFVRLVPLYWLWTLLLIAAWSLMPSVVRQE
jgi:hypothetical protein